MFKSFNRKRLKETSVLNTDKFDKRRFEQLYQMSKGLQRIEQNESLPLFKELLRDIWASLFKVNPELKEDAEIDRRLFPNKKIMERIMKDENYKNYRESTQLDDMLSAIATINFGHQTNQWLQDEILKNEELQKRVSKIMKLMDQIQKNEQNNRPEENDQNNGAEGQDQGSSKSEQELDQAMDSLANELANALDFNSKSFSHAMQNAVDSTKDAKNGLEALFGGKSAGNQKGELTKVPLRDKIAIAEKITFDQKFKKIANWVGRYTEIAQTKQKSKYKTMTEQSGIETGDDIERIIPSELVMYKNPATKKEFLRRFIEKETLQYEQKGKETLGKGSIIVCLDQSGSMRSKEEQSKGFALAFLSIAKKQKRNFAYIPFDSSIGKVRFFPKGKVKTNEIIELAMEFLDGGTKFIPPLTEALNVIKKDSFKDADIIFITDGESSMDKRFIEKFNKQKERDGFQVLTLLLGSSGFENEIEFVSDKVIKAETLNDEGTFELFEI